MSRVDVQFLDRGFHRVLFDAMPMPVFVVDQDVCILDYNSAAAQVVGLDKASVLRRRGGEALHCLHATETPGGCGHSPVCDNCVVRKSVRAAFKGEHITREWARMQLLTNGKSAKVDLRVSCQPFKYEQHAYVLLILEGLND
jgi:PAS domain-containing protein